MHLNPKLGVCPICHNDSGDILLRSLPNGDIRLFEKEDNGPHHVLSPNPCKECEERIGAGYVALIALDPSAIKSDTASSEQIHQSRVGDEIAWIKEEAFKRMFDVAIPAQRVVACEPEVITVLKERMPKED